MIKELLRACHPLPAAAVTMISGALALALGHALPSAALAAATVGASQLSVGWANDAIDARRDQAVDRSDKPLVTHSHLVGTVKIAALIATLVTLAAAWAWGWPRGALIALALASAQLYNWPLKATAASIVPYFVSFAVLPAFLAPGRAPLWMIVAAALLGGGAHLVNAIPDFEQDRVTGVRGLPHRLGEKPSLYLASALLLGATALLVWGARPPAWASVAALALALSLPVLGRWASPRTTFRALLVVAALDVVLLIVSGASH
ncbi:MAG TPA: UbiA family prenyltransferase [Candidatus Limnocylindrales bacterium]